MKPLKPLQLDIPTPCHALPHQMTPAAQGKFCASCQKVVTDFSQMTDRQILEYLSSGQGSGCGSFHPSQLQRPLLVQQPVTSPLRKAWILSIALLAGLWQQAYGSEAAPAIQTEQSNSLQSTKKLKRWHKPGPILGNRGREIKGIVSDSATGEVLSFANIRILNSDITTQADLDGKFQLYVPNSFHDEIVLRVLFIGFKPAEVVVKDVNNDGSVRPDLNIKLSAIDSQRNNQHYYVDGTITVVKGSISTYRHYSGWQNIKFRIRSWFSH